MIESVIVRNRAQSLTLRLARPEESGLVITNIDGLGPVKEEIAISNRGFLDGGYYHSSRKSPRNIVMTLKYAPPVTDESVAGFTTDYTDTVAQMRHKTYKYFPQKMLLTFIFRTGLGVYRTEGYVESNEVNIFSDSCESVISILCPNPYFQKCEDLNGRIGLEDQLTTSATRIDFQYHGDTPSDCMVKITKKGSTVINQVIVQNIVNGSEMILDTSTLKDVGDFIEINTTNGRRIIVANRKSQFGGVTMPAFDLITRISNEWISVVPGENRFTISRPVTSNPDLEVSLHAPVKAVGI